MKEKKQLYFLFEMMIDQDCECYCFNPIKDNMSDMDSEELNNIGTKLLNHYYQLHKIKIDEIGSLLVDNDNIEKKYFNFYDRSELLKKLLHMKTGDDYLNCFISHLSNKFSKNIKKVFFNDFEEDKMTIELKLDYTIDKETLDILDFDKSICETEDKLEINLFMILIAYIYYIIRYKNQRLYFISLYYYENRDNGIGVKSFDMFTCNILDKITIDKYQIDELLIEYLDWCVCNYNNNLNKTLYENAEESCNNFTGDYRLINNLIN